MDVASSDYFMSYHKKILIFIGACVFSSIPAQAQAFTYTQVHSLWQDPAQTSNTAPDYIGPTFPGWGLFTFLYDPIGPFGTYPTYEAMCDSFAIQQGYATSTDFYCVYDGQMISTSFGTPCFGTACSPGTGVSNVYNGNVKLYLTPPTQIAYATLESQLNALFATFWSNVAAGITPNPVPVNPDVCGSEFYDFTTVPGFNPAHSIPLYDRCNVYHHVGGPSSPPVASLTAVSPITAGGSSLLTYTCSNSATSASIDNGVGAVNPPAAGSIPVTPGSTTTYTLTCTNAQGSATSAATVTVTAVSVADLQAGAITPTSATTGSPTTLTSTASNTGTAPSGSFPVLYRISTSPTGSAGDALVLSSLLTPVAIGGSAPSSVSYSFPSAGTYYVRAYANTNLSWLNVVTESDYGNNAGPWTAVTVSAAAASAPTCSLSAAPPSTVPTTLTWSSTNATSCTGGGFSTGNATSGSVPIATAGPYTLTCNGAGGSCSSNITLGGACSGTPTGTITSSKTRVKSGVDKFDITVSNITNVTTSCVVTGPGVNQTISANACTATGISIPNLGPITTQSVYKLTCDGTKISEVIVNILPNFREF